MKLRKVFGRKINIVAAVLLLLFGISIGAYLVLKSKSGSANFLEQLTQNIGQGDIINDADFDGLNEWEEKIHKTDPNNPDTDGDGYLDGEEVASGHDPTKKAPDDKILDGSENTNAAKRKRPNPGNLSQTLSYLLGKEIDIDPLNLASAQNPIALEETINEAMDEKVAAALQMASANFLSEFIPPFEKEQSEFEIALKNDLAAIQNYAKETSGKLGELDFCQNINNPKNEMEVIKESIETKNFEQIKCLSKSYLRAYQETIKTPPPLDWLDIHKQFLSIYWGLHKVHQYLPEFENDPLKGILILEKYKELNEDLIGLLKQMASDLDSR